MKFSEKAVYDIMNHKTEKVCKQSVNVVFKQNLALKQKIFLGDHNEGWSQKF